MAITPDSLEPNPKNPIIADFFRNIGYADQLGSGVRNLFKYSNYYSEQEKSVMDCIARQPEITAAEVASETELSKRTVERILQHLKEDGSLRREGSRRKGRWVLLRIIMSEYLYSENAQIRAFFHLVWILRNLKS